MNKCASCYISENEYLTEYIDATNIQALLLKITNAHY